MGWFGQGQNSQGTLCPRVATSKNFGRGHIGQGWTNIAPFYAIFFLKVRGFFENVVGGGGGVYAMALKKSSNIQMEKSTKCEQYTWL
jgi:hypothetical protein